VWAERTGRVGVEWTLTPPTERASAGPPREEAAVRLLGLVRRTRWAGPAWALEPQMARAPAGALQGTVAVRLLERRERRAGPARALAPPSAAVGPEAPEREGMRRGVPGQEGPRMEAEPVLPRGGWQTWAVHLAIHHLQSEPPVWRP